MFATVLTYHREFYCCENVKKISLFETKSFKKF